MKKRLALIDADSMIYIVAWKFRSKNIPNLVKMNLNSFINDALHESGATHYIGFYGSQEEDAEPNFRYSVDPDYKKTRPETPDFITKWRPTIHKTMKEKWGFMPVSGMEADDAVAIAASKYRDEFDSIVVITADKDLKQIPNITHFDMNKRITTEIDQFDADKFFCEQMLKGDPGDAIKGLPGIGPKKAVTVLEPCTNSVQLKWTVIRMYKQHFDEQGDKIERANRKSIENEWLDANKEALDIDGYTPKQIERKARLHTDIAVADLIKEELPSTWKEYITQQYKLLRMLEIAPEGVVLPEPVEYEEYVEKEDQEEKPAIKDIMNI